MSIPRNPKDMVDGEGIPVPFDPRRAAADKLAEALRIAQPYVANVAEAGALFNRRDLEAVNIALAEWEASRG